MIYYSREEVERIGRAGSCLREGVAFRYLSSFWLNVEQRDVAFTPHGPDGFWEAWITCWMSKQFDKHDMFLDVGANVGYYGMMAMTHGLDTMFFEPNPELVELISKSVNDNNLEDKCLGVMELALSNKEGISYLTVPDRHSGGASIGEKNEGSFKVPTATMDSIIYAGLSNILVKIDAEGAEPLIWAGMQKTLARAESYTVLLEWEGTRFDAEEFAQDIFQSNDVFYVNFAGDEVALTHWKQLVALEGLYMVGARKAI